MNRLIKTILFCGLTFLIFKTTNALAKNLDFSIHTTGMRLRNNSAHADPDSTLNKPAPPFTLKDRSGKSVSLSDYKGKIIVIDFWATWCVPCRESFPAMRLVMDKYKEDRDIKFLFIDTREVSKDSQALVENFLKETGYSFDVLFDEKGKDGKMNRYYLEYVMPGIPTKIFIDKQGILRSKSIGFKPGQTAEEGAKDISIEIENLRK
ncbi:TlpA family protein disulfide reductase [Pedobacter paludis]|uniref:Thioredoxin domain-containing protein n=1 Tax=Pedobacter paludis TaxID=2203212 RepID=A0A317EX48_9SPHI|nr:TlpA disulfide reductase family protein [Pedobacter paludis]PWS30407.1 hypothetical protein DF947_18460 [Pedobacter paludis]